MQLDRFSFGLWICFVLKLGSLLLLFSTSCGGQTHLEQGCADSYNLHLHEHCKCWGEYFVKHNLYSCSCLHLIPLLMKATVGDNVGSLFWINMVFTKGPSSQLLVFHSGSPKASGNSRDICIQVPSPVSGNLTHSLNIPRLQFHWSSSEFSEYF